MLNEYPAGGMTSSAIWRGRAMAIHGHTPAISGAQAGDVGIISKLKTAADLREPGGHQSDLSNAGGGLEEFGIPDLYACVIATYYFLGTSARRVIPTTSSTAMSHLTGRRIRDRRIRALSRTAVLAGVVCSVEAARAQTPSFTLEAALSAPELEG